MKPSTILVPALAGAGIQAQSLGQCRAACRGGTAAMNAFCRVIPLLPVRAACWPIGIALRTPGAQTACANWCYNYFGDGANKARGLDAREEEEISLAHDIEIQGLDLSEFEEDEELDERDSVGVEWSA